MASKVQYRGFMTHWGNEVLEWVHLVHILTCKPVVCLHVLKWVDEFVIEPLHESCHSVNCFRSDLYFPCHSRLTYSPLIGMWSILKQHGAHPISLKAIDTNTSNAGNFKWLFMGCYLGTRSLILPSTQNPLFGLATRWRWGSSIYQKNRSIIPNSKW